MWNLLLGVKGFHDNPSLSFGDRSPQEGPLHKSESLNKNQPPLKREGNRRQTVEGFFCEIFCLV